MKLIYLSLVALFLTSLAGSAIAQRKKSSSTTKTGQPAIDSVKWRVDHYIEDRDAAYADPRIALKKLVGGNRRFVEGKSIKPRQDSIAIHGTEAGQKPFAIIVGCSDSRVPNEIIFDQGVGDLFIVRTAGQVMAEASYGSIEFANLVLGAKLIVVLGHKNCGAVDAAIKRPDNPPGHIATLINAIKPAAERSRYMPGDRLDNAVHENVVLQVTELKDLEPVLAKRYKNGDILVVGAVYDLATGKVEFLPETLNSVPGLNH